MPSQSFPKLKHVLSRCLRASLILLGLVMFNGSAVESLDGLRIDFHRFDQVMEQRFGTQGLEASRSWQTLLADLHGLPEIEKLERVNRFFHQHMHYRLDSDLYGREDYWATPLESLGHAAGDCEDYVIAKYVSLRFSGVADDRLRLVYVRARMGGPRSTIYQAHMVLTYQASPSAEPLVLDSLLNEILPTSLRDDLIPVFSFNLGGMWAGNNPASVGSSTARISRWRNVVQRMQDEGIEW